MQYPVITWGVGMAVVTVQGRGSTPVAPTQAMAELNLGLLVNSFYNCYAIGQTTYIEAGLASMYKHLITTHQIG